MKVASALLLATTIAAVARAAAAEQAAPTPPAQSVVVPSLPDQKNKETTTRPSGTLATDAAGWVKNGPEDPAAKRASDAASAAEKVAPGRGTPGVLPPPSAPAPSPGGPAVVEAAHVTLRGVVKGYEKRTSITIVEAGGRERTVPLAGNAAVYEGLKAGDRIVLRIPLGKPGDGKSTDRIEKETPRKAPPKSKFAAAQTPSN